MSPETLENLRQSGYLPIAVEADFDQSWFPSSPGRQIDKCRVRLQPVAILKHRTKRFD